MTRTILLLTTALVAGAAPAAAQRLRVGIPIEQLEASARTDSNDAAAQYNLGLGYWSKARYDDAEKSFQRAIAIEPRFALAHLALAYLPFARRSKLWDETLEGKVPTDWTAAVHTSDLEYRRAMMADPLVDLKIMGAVEPGIPAIWQANDYLAKIYEVIFRGFDDFRDGKYESAYSRFNQQAQALDWDGHRERASTSFLYYRGLSAAHIGRFPEAVDDIQMIYARLEEDEADHRDSITYLPLRTNEFRYLLADLMVLNGDPRDAAPLFQKVAETDAGNFMAHVRLADLREAAHDWDAAVNERHRAIDANPDDASLETDLGMTLGKAGRFADAEVAFAEAARANPHDTRSLYWLGIARANLGKAPEAKQAFQQFVATAPSRFARQIDAAKARIAQLGGAQ